MSGEIKRTPENEVSKSADQDVGGMGGIKYQAPGACVDNQKEAC